MTNLTTQKEHHRSQGWRVTALAPEFELLDVWDYPAGDSDGQDIDSLIAAAERRFTRVMQSRSAAGLLFRLREALGRWFSWDGAVNELPVPGSTDTSLRLRLTAAESRTQRWSDGSAAILGDTAMGGFAEVYRAPSEALFEISNATVHALLHFGVTADGPKLAVYVCPRGLVGRAYMALIEPFRHYVVYPALLAA